MRFQWKLSATSLKTRHDVPEKADAETTKTAKSWLKNQQEPTKRTVYKKNKTTPLNSEANKPPCKLSKKWLCASRTKARETHFFHELF